MGLFMDLKITPPEVEAAKNAFALLDKRDALQVVRDSVHWDHIVEAARDELADAGDVVPMEDHRDTLAELKAANDEIKRLQSGIHADAARLQSLNAEGDRDAALSLLREMFDGAGLLSDAAAIMVAGFRQGALL